jgi:hypothetical protein
MDKKTNNDQQNTTQKATIKQQKNVYIILILSIPHHCKPTVFWPNFMDTARTHAYNGTDRVFTLYHSTVIFLFLILISFLVF